MFGGLPRTFTTTILFLSLACATLLGGCSRKDSDPARAPASNDPPTGSDNPQTQSIAFVAALPKVDPIAPPSACSLPESDDLLDVFGVPVGGKYSVKILMPATRSEDTVWRVSSRDDSIASITGGSVELTVPAKTQLSNEPFEINGHMIGKVQILFERKNSEGDFVYSDESPAVVWDIEDIVDYNDLGGGEICYDPNNSPNLTPDLNARTTCGTTPDAVAADGTSLLLARLKAGGEGRACFTVIEDSVPSPASSPEAYLGKFDNAKDVASQQIGSDDAHWVFGTYTPPTDYFDSTASRKIKVEVQFIPKNRFGSYTLSRVTAVQKEIEIRRPPVLLVHGLWSSAKTWGDRFKNPGDGWKVDGDFSYPSALPFSTTGPTEIVKHRINQLIKDYRELNRVATTKVDIIGHSMGGLRSRRWISDEAYLAPSNFKKGNVRKLVTLTTPHLGSPLANMLVNLHQRLTNPADPTDHYGEMAALEKFLPGELHEGAVCELADNNPALTSSPINGVRAIAYTATGGPKDDWAFLLDLGLAVVLDNPIRLILGDTLKTDHADPYIFHARNDKIVDEESQIGRLPVASNFKDKSHLDLPSGGVTGLDEVAEAIFAKLNTTRVDIEPDWAETLPSVSVNPLGAIPRHGGRGVDGDGNYGSSGTRVGKL